MHGNRKHEETTRHITNVQKPALHEARYRRCDDLVESQPVEGDGERNRLLQIGQQEIVDEDEVLVVSDVFSMMSSPTDQSPCYEYEQQRNGYERHHSEERHRDEALLIHRRHRVQRIGIGIVALDKRCSRLHLKRVDESHRACVLDTVVEEVYEDPIGNG